MSANPCRNNLLDVLPGFSDEEEVTGVHVRPTISMPPFPQRPTEISRTVLMLVAEAEADEKLEDLTDFAQDEDDVETEVVTLVQAAPTPPVCSPVPSPASSPALVASSAPATRATSRLGRTALALTAFGFGIGFFLTSPPSPPAAMTAEPASELVSVPSVVVEPTPAAAAAAAAAPAPIEKAETPAPKAAHATTLADADRALRAGQLANAESIYQSFLARGGADHEALTGLGKVAAARHQTTDAMAFFERAIARQPGYLPARLGLADVLWDAGRTDAAKAQYEEIRARYSPSVFPLRVLERTR